MLDYFYDDNPDYANHHTSDEERLGVIANFLNANQQSLEVTGIWVVDAQGRGAINYEALRAQLLSQKNFERRSFTTHLKCSPFRHRPYDPINARFSALQIACDIGPLPFVKAVLAAYPKKTHAEEIVRIQEHPWEGRLSALHIAVYSGSLPIASFLMEELVERPKLLHKALQAENFVSMTPLEMCAYAGHLKCLALLFDALGDEDEQRAYLARHRGLGHKTQSYGGELFRCILASDQDDKSKWRVIKFLIQRGANIADCPRTLYEGNEYARKIAYQDELFGLALAQGDAGDIKTLNLHLYR